MTENSPRTRQIAVIDDLLPNTLLIKSYMRRIEGVEAVTFTNPDEGLVWCKKNEPDVIIVDYHMPEMTAVEFIYAIRDDERVADIPIVVVTSEESNEALYAALQAGATDFLRKPVDELELIARTDNMLKLRARQLELAAANRRLRVLADTDPLTSLPNRRSFMDALHVEAERGRRHGRPLSLALLDIDHFKNVNDTYGHDSGDKLLCAIAATMERELRISDKCGRLGGEEFAIFFPETGRTQAYAVCERLMSSFRVLRLNVGAHVLQCTVSIGLVEFLPDSDDTESLIRRADVLMYQAKKNGRDRVEYDANPVEDVPISELPLGGIDPSLEPTRIETEPQFADQ